MTSLNQIRIVIASPNDVREEREALTSIIERVNSNTAGRLRLILRLERWETDTYPGFHVDGPQGLVDSILKIEDCDILIGIFWKRFGTPTSDGKTGTEHEFYKAYEAWKKNNRPQIMLYFNQKEYSPNTTTELEQHLAVLKFRDKLPKETFYRNYRGIDTFRDMVYDHLTNYIQDTYRPPEPEREPSHSPQIVNTAGDVIGAGISGSGNIIAKDTNGNIYNFYIQNLSSELLKNIITTSTALEISPTQTTDSTGELIVCSIISKSVYTSLVRRLDTRRTEIYYLVISKIVII
jgi:hypothetical protein